MDLQDTCPPNSLAQGSSWRVLRTAVGKNHRGRLFCCLAKQKKTLEILSGGLVLAELAVAISGVVGMVSSPL